MEWWKIVILSLLISSFSKFIIRLLWGLWIFIRLSLFWIVDDYRVKKPWTFKEISEKQEKHREKLMMWDGFWKYMHKRIKEEVDKLDKWIF
jgi:hypothetical protein